jgi:hypothetical protein
MILGLASKEKVLNEFLIGQKLYRDRSGSLQGSSPMRNSFNVFPGGRKRQDEVFSVLTSPWLIFLQRSGW